MKKYCFILFFVIAFNSCHIDYYSIDPEFQFPISENDTAWIWKYADLKNIPEGIDKYKSLKYIDFSFNSIKYITPTIESLRNLIYLNLQDNQIDSLPFDICNFKKLEYLNLLNNDISLIEVLNGLKGNNEIDSLMITSYNLIQENIYNYY